MGRGGKRNSVKRRLLIVIAMLAGPIVATAAERPEPRTIAVGSKAFTESVILGEIVSQTAARAGYQARHRSELGGTVVLWNALLAGEIDVYPEYTGTIAQEILRRDFSSDDAIRRALRQRGVEMTGRLGFNNSYAIGMRSQVAKRLGIGDISDLAAHPELRLGFSNEFMDRQDGWPGMSQRYAFRGAEVRGLSHDLAYRALNEGMIDATDLYSTDAEIQQYGLKVLEDDRAYFPNYQAVLLYRAELSQTAPKLIDALGRLERAITSAEMISMNAQAKLHGQSEREVAAKFLSRRFGTRGDSKADSLWSRLAARTVEHLYLVGISLLAAVVVAVPLGILAARLPAFGQLILAATGIIQTVPSLVVLVLMIPLLGIGGPPAIAALFLYSLLPIVRNTHTGLLSIPTPLIESARALGLSNWASLRLVELPLASRTILAGIKTAAVINVGTATLGAIIGAGGYGQPILSGIRLADTSLMLEGALPAAAMAVVTQLVFDLIDRLIAPAATR